jgi:small GTP-binding protein
MEEENCEVVKVVLLGEQGVGKTCIITRYLNNTFDEEEMSTTGASYASKTMLFPEYNKALKFEIWDTAGQEKFKALTRIFYKDSNIAILVYDITKKNTFEELKNYWFSQVKDNAPKNCIISIAANKYDLFENEQVSENEARKFAEENGLMFRCTSALTAEGIDDLFKDVGSKYLDVNYNPNDKKKIDKKGDGDSKKNNDNSTGGNIKLDAKTQNKTKKGNSITSWC